jgi:hypothetical protein
VLSARAFRSGVISFFALLKARLDLADIAGKSPQSAHLIMLIVIVYLLDLRMLRFTRQGNARGNRPRALRTSLPSRLVLRRSSIRWVTLAASLGFEGIGIVMATERGVNTLQLGGTGSAG